MKRIDWMEMDELIAHLTGAKEDDDMENALYEKYEIGSDELSNILNDLMPLISVAPSPITGTMYMGFSKETEPGHREWIIKREWNQ